MKVQITNTTKNKIVLTIDAKDLIDAAGKYISVLMVAGLVSFNQKEVVFAEGSGADFSLSHKGWNFKVEEIAA